MNIDVAIARLEAAKTAEHPEEAVGHLLAASANVKLLLKKTSNALAERDPRQAEINFEAPKPKGTTVTVGADGVVQTPADTASEVKPYRDPVNEGMIIDFLRRETIGGVEYGPGERHASILDDRGGVLAVKTKAIAEHTGIEEGVVSRILSRLVQQGVDVVSPKRGWYRAAEEERHTFAHGDTNDFTYAPSDVDDTYDEQGAVTPIADADDDTEPAPGQPILGEQQDAPLHDEEVMPTEGPPTDMSMPDMHDGSPVTPPSVVRSTEGAPPDREALRAHVQQRRQEGVPDDVIAAEIRALMHPQGVGAVSDG